MDPEGKELNSSASRGEMKFNNEIMKSNFEVFGRWQIRTIIILLAFNFPAIWQAYSYDFAKRPNDFYCTKPSTLNTSEGEWVEISQISTDFVHGRVFDPCFVYDIDYNDDREVKMLLSGKIPPRRKCNNWTYSDGDCQETLTEKWNLVCHRETLTEILKISYLFGLAVGSIPLGIMSDYLGRQYAIRTLTLLQSVAGVLLIVMPVFWAYILSRFLLGFFTIGVWTTSLVLCWEIMDGKASTISAFCHLFSTSVALFLSGIMRRFISSYRENHLLLFTALAMLCCLVWKIPESPKWLLIKGKVDACVKQVNHAAAQNKMPYPVKIRRVLQEQSNLVYGRMTFGIWIRSQYIRNRVLGMFVAWYGLFLLHHTTSKAMKVSIRGDVLDATYSFLVELPAMALAAAIVLFFKKRKEAIISILISAGIIAMIISNNVKKYIPLLILRMITTIGTGVLPIYALESIPTKIRNTAIGIFAFAGALSIMTSLYINKLSNIGPRLYFGSAGIAAAIAGISSATFQDINNRFNIDSLPFARNSGRSEGRETPEELQSRKDSSLPNGDLK